MSSIDIDFRGFYTIALDKLGELCALILCQAQVDGVTRVNFHYGNNKMIYTIDGVDYDMVPCPAPANVDMVRALAKASNACWDKPGKLTVAFADCALNLTVTHHQGADDPFLEVSGFTGEPCEWIHREPEEIVHVAAAPDPS